jgi:hypothetical protein
MTFCSLCRISLIGCSLWACVSQYTSPGPEVEGTSTQPSSDSSEEAREATGSSREADDEAERAPSEASGTCDDRSCVSTTDCCSGYQCGFDPERSKVMRYCLAQ